jgi:hypothetical protein
MGVSAKRLAAFTLAAVSTVVVSGCHTFEPVDTVSIGDEVRARLTTAEAIRQSEVTGEPLRVLEGRIAGMDEESLQVDVVTARGQRLTESFRYSTSYIIPRMGLEELSLRRISPVRTGLVVAILGAGLYWLLDSTVIGQGGSDDGGPPVDPADVIVPFLPGR